MVSREEFEKYKKSLFSQDDKEAFKEELKGLKRSKFIALGCELLVFAALVIVEMCLKRWNFVTMMFLSFAWVMIVSVTYGSYRVKEKKMIGALKQKKLPKLLEFMIGKQFNDFSAERFLPREEFKMAGFAGAFDNYSGEDLIDIDIPKDNGERSGVSFQACDLYVTKDREDSDGNTTTTTVYHGTFAAVHFPFQFKCRLGINSSPGGVKKFKLEDMSFNKKFQVFTNDQVEALCILTPNMMQKLSKLIEKTKKLNISIFDNHLFLGFPNFNILELGASKDGLDESVFDGIYDDVALLLSIVDEIKRNNKVFKI